ncbi:wax ester/triacylglycerol synthase family O-acyltransferase [Nocardia sp. NPDC050710]|uniref:WS/DGAT/MGAT family O-acyltransferase n=1 Tax=Nocardia sp. NPDC050710 TaxID=3157220 RepID=UPI0033E20334
MKFVSPVDAMFLLAESHANPMHVGSVLLFEPPPDAGPDFAHAAYDTLLAESSLHPRFRTRPAGAFGTQLMWSTDCEVDLGYHVRRWALPSPGGADELFELTSQLHGTLLDRNRPLWEMHLVEGLRDGRFAFYSKMHHALMDGVSALRLLQETLTDDPASEEARAPWNLPRARHRRPVSRSLRDVAAHTVQSAAASGPAVLRVARAALLEHQLITPGDVPRTIFNVPVGAARRCAGRSWPLERIKQVKKATGSTVNDVVLAMSAGALRAYLSERNALPDKPLVAMVPVSLRDDHDEETSGNQIAALLCGLATDVADPIQRLQRISESMRRGKDLYRSLSGVQAMALSALLLSPLTLSQLPGLGSRTNPPFNVVISNVRGPQDALYWMGARLDATYPMSIPVHGVAANITVTSNAATLDFGLTGCRLALPDLHRLLDHLDNSLMALEQHC